MYKFNLQIGDWSKDGHCVSKDVIISSNKSPEDVRKIYYDSFEKTGIKLEDICSNYDESCVDDDIIEKLYELGFYDYLYGENIPLEEVEPSLDVEDYVKLFIFLMEYTDNELKLMTVKGDIPNFHFYGFEDGKHIGQFGYGLFYG